MKLALCLAIAALGGVVFSGLGVPLPYMLGSIGATMLAALCRAPISQPERWLVVPMRVVLGVLLGSAVTPALLANLKPLLGALAFVPGYVVLASVFGMFYYRRVAGLSPKEAFFAGLPGGIFTLTAFAEDAGVDTRRVAVCHAVRVTAVVILVPWLISTTLVESTQSVLPTLIKLADVPLREILLMIGAGLLGSILGHFSRLPGGLIVGALLVSAGFRLAGWTHSPPPIELTVLAQVILGASIGARFIGQNLAQLRLLVVQVLGYVLVSLTLTVLVALCLTHWVGIPSVSGVIAFAPGGLAEMSLVALGLGLDVGFVTTLQVARILMVVMLSPLIFQWLSRSGRL